MMELAVFISIFAFAAFTLSVFFIVRERRRKALQEESEYLRLQERISEATAAVLQNYSRSYAFLEKGLLDNDHFFTYAEMQKFLEENRSLLKEMAFLSENNSLEGLGEEVVCLFKKLSSLDAVRTLHNADFEKKELDENQSFFNTLFKYPLDLQQRKSIVDLEDNCLVVSSAGSGKTSTMVGKLLYLVQKRKIQPSRILTITYTRKASDELTSRLMGTGLSCQTFHKLALTIVASVENKKPSIADESLFMTVFYNQLKDIAFKTAVLNYLTDYKSMVKSEHEYTNSFDYYRDRKKFGVVALYTDKNNRLISTKSEEEKKICSYLTELGVSFLYEEPYEHSTLTENYRQYKPDFTIFYTDREGKVRRLYLEHFAVDRQGRVPLWFGSGQADGWSRANERYHESIQWKKELHKRYGTKMVYTTSANFHDGTIRETLRRLLADEGVAIKEMSSDELLDKIISRSKNVENALLQMTQAFVNLVKANDKSIDDVKRQAENAGSTRDVFVIEHLMRPLWNSYQKALNEREEMDFTDVIVRATKCCEQGKWHHKYDYILIDEFQDISIDRYRFLKSLMTEIPRTKLYCVGDDWQSIYRFSGSDLSLFADFPRYFGFTDECKIETTYRFGNPLVTESSEFIQRNPMQKKKSVRPMPGSKAATKVSCVGYKDTGELQSLVERMVSRVPEGKTIYVISRYSYDVKALACPRFTMAHDPNSDALTLKIANKRVKFMTIHGSKGLEADYVFILNCNSGLYGFPSLVSDDPVLDYVLSRQEHYEYAEERRVFYVGLTRAKVHTVVLYDVHTPSPFITEIDSSVELNTDPCPLCGVGHRVVKYSGVAKNKRPYRVWGCDNKEANCQYFYREFLNGRRRSKEI